MRIVCRTLQPDVRFGTCVKAELANAAMNLLTPAHSGGGPAQIYMLTRAGVRAGTLVQAAPAKTRERAAATG